MTLRRANPVAPQPAMVLTAHARFTVLTDHLIRMEWSRTGRFEDRASQFVINRRMPPCKFEIDRKGKSLTITTLSLHLHYRDDGRPFHKANLTIRRHDWPGRKNWTPSSRPAGNLGGTARTLDEVSGATRLEPGVISRDGWALVDDSTRLVYEPDLPNGWPAPRAEAKAIDWYFFGHGHDYKMALHDFTLIAGRPPLIPRYALGYWWSRYWAYHETELKQIVKQHASHRVPLDVLVIDMDWHLPGWTGYTWNPKYFPDPDRFLQWCRDEKLRTTLNLHPADGVARHEARFRQFARAMNIDPAKVDRIPFDCADRTYMNAYFKILHHPLEKQGIDFWWIDWQQGTTTKIPGLDPLWQLNDRHWRDALKRSARRRARPMIFSRWAGLGNHRQPIGFSGDTHSNWDSLTFQPQFTATACNVGYGCWSHDIGGHFPGKVDPELYLRWIQLGVFSPILRTHTTMAPDAERRIWKFPSVFNAMREAIRWRYRLIPYIYTTLHQAHETGVSLCRPLYYQWPERDEAYEHPTQYLFGNDLLIAPVTRPVNRKTRRAKMKIWLPPGNWRDFFTGKSVGGDKFVTRAFRLDQIPVFVRAGAIIPMAPPVMRTDDLPGDLRILRVYAGPGGRAQLYEDDGKTDDYRQGRSALTTMSLRRTESDRCELSIGPTHGKYDAMHQRSRYELELYGFGPVRAIRVGSRKLPRSGSRNSWTVHDRGAWVSVQLAPRRVYTGTRILIETKKKRKRTTSR